MWGNKGDPKKGGKKKIEEDYTMYDEPVEEDQELGEIIEEEEIEEEGSDEGDSEGETEDTEDIVDESQKQEKNKAREEIKTMVTKLQDLKTLLGQKTMKIETIKDSIRMATIKTKLVPLEESIEDKTGENEEDEEESDFDEEL